MHHLVDSPISQILAIGFHGGALFVLAKHDDLASGFTIRQTCGTDYHGATGHVFGRHAFGLMMDTL
jgi:hypothetical protein